jgi:hypothetical protein
MSTVRLEKNWRRPSLELTRNNQGDGLTSRGKLRLLNHWGGNRKEDRCDDRARRCAHPRTDARGVHPCGVMSGVLYLMAKRPGRRRPEDKDQSNGQRPGGYFHAFGYHGHSKCSHAIDILSTT